MKKWRGLAELVRDAVDQGATAVEQVHRRTAATPFALLELVPPLALPVRGVRAAHDVALSGAYGMVRWVNHVVGTAVGVAIDTVERGIPHMPGKRSRNRLSASRWPLTRAR